MSSSDFEKNVQDELDDLSIEPSDVVWDRVEATLPEKDRRRWLLLFIPLLIGAGIFFIANFYKTSNDINQSTSAKAVVSEKSAEQSKYFPDTSNANSAFKNSADVKAIDTENSPKARQDEMTITGAGPQKSTEKVIPYPISHRSKNTIVDLSNDGHVTTTIINAMPDNDVRTEVVSPRTAIRDNVERPDASVFKPDTSIASNLAPLKSDKLNVTESSDTIVKDLGKQQNKKVNAKWILGVTAGAGSSDLKGGLFNNNQMYADVYSSGSPSSAPSSPPTSGTKPNEPTASFAFTAGMTFDKNISTKVRLHTGLQYAYLSSRIMVGMKVDSAGGFLTNSGSSLVNSYYRNGNTENYLNRIHFISLPVTLQFSPLTKLPLYGEVGLTTSFLISSNVLQYSSSRNAYFENPESLNRLAFGLQAGLGAQLKSFKLGYRFNYGLTPVAKDGAQQYPVSSIIYLQLPLKKF